MASLAGCTSIKNLWHTSFSHLSLVHASCAFSFTDFNLSPDLVIANTYLYSSEFNKSLGATYLVTWMNVSWIATVVTLMTFRPLLLPTSTSVFNFLLLCIKAQENTSPSPVVSWVVFKLPQFWTSNAEAWFNQLKAHFSLWGITSQDTMYWYMVALFDNALSVHISPLLPLLNSPERYT